MIRCFTGDDDRSYVLKIGQAEMRMNEGVLYCTAIRQGPYPSIAQSSVS
jgi:hypothetical protein